MSRIRATKGVAATLPFASPPVEKRCYCGARAPFGWTKDDSRVWTCRDHLPTAYGWPATLQRRMEDLIRMEIVKNTPSPGGEGGNPFM